MQQALEALSAELWTMLDKPVDEQYRVKYAYLLTLITALRTALAQPKHEPMAVAYLCENGVGHRYFRWKKPSDIYKPIGLYTAPPQREWVGLTDEEQQQLFDQWQDNGWGSFYNAIEAKLKELNK
jgi:hypothetical protein